MKLLIVRVLSLETGATPIGALPGSDSVLGRISCCRTTHPGFEHDKRRSGAQTSRARSESYPRIFRTSNPPPQQPCPP